MALPIWALYMKKVLNDSSLGYSSTENFDVPGTFNATGGCEENLFEQALCIRKNKYFSEIKLKKQSASIYIVKYLAFLQGLKKSIYTICILN